MHSRRSRIQRSLVPRLRVLNLKIHYLECVRFYMDVDNEDDIPNCTMRYNFLVLITSTLLLDVPDE
jgi:hypothetical protein